MDLIFTKSPSCHCCPWKQQPPEIPSKECTQVDCLNSQIPNKDIHSTNESFISLSIMELQPYGQSCQMHVFDYENYYENQYFEPQYPENKQTPTTSIFDQLSHKQVQSHHPKTYIPNILKQHKMSQSTQQSPRRLPGCPRKPNSKKLQDFNKYYIRHLINLKKQKDQKQFEGKHIWNGQNSINNGDMKLLLSYFSTEEQIYVLKQMISFFNMKKLPPSEQMNWPLFNRDKLKPDKKDSYKTHAQDLLNLFETPYSFL